MRHDFWAAGLLGLGAGAIIYIGASALSTWMPFRLPGIFAIVTFVFLFALSVVEFPFMLLGLRQMARSATTPRRLWLATFALFVMFAPVYASICVLLTGDIFGSGALAALGLVRFAGGFLIR